jgi:hypothetical protein
MPRLLTFFDQWLEIEASQGERGGFSALSPDPDCCLLAKPSRRIALLGAVKETKRAVAA